MPRLDRLPQINRNNLLLLPVQVNESAPRTPLPRPLSGCRLAIVTTAGLHRRADRPFGPGEQTFRVIPAETPSAEIVQSHTSLGFDRVPIMRDLKRIEQETGPEVGRRLREEGVEAALVTPT